jgi:dienelactone hydrolase
MIVARYLFALSLPIAAQQLYEEDLKATQPLREKLWRQMDDYSKAQEGSVESLRRVFLNRIGYPIPGLRATGPLRLERTGEDESAVYHRAWLPLSGGMDAYGLYIVPKKPLAKRAPLVISQHGGGGFPEMATFYGGTNYKDQVRGAIKEGYIVYAPLTLMYPFGDRDRGTAIPADVRKVIDARLRSQGTSLAALDVMKIKLALDALTNRPEIDPNRIAMIGLSYGGFYSTYVAALDPRIKVVVASCSFRNDPAIVDGTAEGRLLDLAPAEIAALIAPRPLQIQSGIRDNLIPIEPSRIAAKRALDYYTRQGAADKLSFEEFDGGHEFRGSLVWPFLKRWL